MQNLQRENSMASLRNFSMVSALLFVVPVSALAVGCTVETVNEPPPGPQYTYPSEADFCAAIAAAECTDQVVDACYASVPEKLAEDRAKCVAARTDPARCNPSSFAYFPQFADACVASRAKIYTDAELTKQEIEDDYEACLPVFSRGGRDGSACTIDIDCDTSTDLRCVIKGTTGTCRNPVEAAGGDECTAPDTVCADTHYCDGSNCLTRKNAGAACSDVILCGEDLKCDATSSTCVAKLGGGETCLVDEDCQGFCILTAGETDGTCAGKIVLEISSQTCDSFQP
jgi:hypothetical protein